MFVVENVCGGALDEHFDERHAAVFRLDRAEDLDQLVEEFLLLGVVASHVGDDERVQLRDRLNLSRNQQKSNLINNLLFSIISAVTWN